MMFGFSYLKANILDELNNKFPLLPVSTKLQIVEHQRQYNKVNEEPRPRSRTDCGVTIRDDYQEAYSMLVNFHRFL